MKYKDLIKATSFQINSSDIYLWQCFGSNCKIYDLILPTSKLNNPSLNNNNLHQNDDDLDLNYIGSFVADNNGKIYQSYFYDEKNNTATRWVDPEYLSQYKKEYNLRNLDFTHFLETVPFTDILNDKDYLNILEQHYQDNIPNTLDNSNTLKNTENIIANLDDDTFLAISKMAHEKNITLNDMANELLESHLLTLIENKAKLNLPTNINNPHPPIEEEPIIKNKHNHK